ncbi:hypothetical protein BpHYR1_014198 [Brachionus plicatilis]|uniref:Uncharacterized protein n=1 Tax=Brachionus plicatilis TaxID=10195 RepID=A0A3M7S9S8_BRAPC|nr:hypothetical protein BpHYR1_014198 [Brachionus plicatilis]
MRLFMRSLDAKNIKSEDLRSTGLIVNFLSLNEMLRISLHGKPILGIRKKNLKIKESKKIFIQEKFLFSSLKNSNKKN